MSLCTASSLTQAWSCRGGGKGGDSGAGCFPGPPHSPFLLELLLLPNLPECSTHPALNASFPRLIPRYCLQVLPNREKGIAKQFAGTAEEAATGCSRLFFLPLLLSFFFFFLPFLLSWRPPSSQRGGTERLRLEKGELCNAYH